MRAAIAMAWLAALCAASSPAARAQNPSCASQVARVVSLQGNVALRPAAAGEWQAVRQLDTPLCRGDRLRTGPDSRAALFIAPESLLRVDRNTTVSVRVDGDETVVEFFIDEGSQGNACGAGYAISRFPRKFKIHTPFSYAAVEGTEFLVALTCSTATVSVFEGRVSVEERLERASRVVLESGQTTTVGPDLPQEVKVIVQPVDAVQWALYYPALSELSDGDRVCAQADGQAMVSCLIARAEQRLRTGRVDAAQVDIENALRESANNGDALALLAIIATTKNDKARALGLAGKATEVAPQAYRAWLALSYAQQADFKLEDALRSAQRAAGLAPRSTTVQARVAELLMSLNRTREAEKAAQAAVNLDPAQSRAQTVLGFVYLAEIDTTRAKEAFEAAIERDSADPLPRLGLGLAIIRDGDLVGGRQQIEIAVVLDPTNSLIRSYVGKAYYEENTAERDRLAASQFRLAKALDPNDPTPWFYDALLKQTQNRPVEAVDELQQSVRRNDNRGVYRSRLLLDRDLGARLAAVSQIYTSTGLRELARTEAAASVAEDPTNSSGHQLLARSMLDMPRHEIGRASEILQATLLQPSASHPTDLRIATTNLSLVPGYDELPLGPADAFSLFDQDGIHGGVAALGGNQGTSSLEGGLYGQARSLSFNAGGFLYESNGFRENNDVRHVIGGALLQADPNRDVSLQAEVRSRDTEQGDLALDFDPQAFLSSARRHLHEDIARLGIRARLSPGATLLLSWQGIRRDEDQDIPTPGLRIVPTLDTRGNNFESQLLFTTGRISLVAGALYAQANNASSTLLDFSPIPCPLPACEFIANTVQRQRALYAYGTWSPTRSVSATLGLSYESLLNEANLELSRINPKFGVRWQPVNWMVLRMAAFKAMTGIPVAKQNLEPTQVAGFNQFFDDYLGTRSARGAAGIDLLPRLGTLIGAELSARQLNKPKTAATGDTVFELQDEVVSRIYLSQQLGSRWVVGVQGMVDRFYREDLGDSDIVPLQVTTKSVTPSIRYFHPNGFFGAVSSAFVDQVVKRDPVYPDLQGSSSFTVVDLTAGYRLPRRRGYIALEIRNAFDAQFEYQDDNFRTSERRQDVVRYIPARSIWIRGALHF